MDDDISDISELSSPPASPIAPPGFFPSPPPSQEDQRQEGPPANKRRRVAAPKEPKERVSRQLDLTPDAPFSPEEQQSQIDLLVKTLRKHRKIVVIAGAGISTSAGSTCHTSPLQPFYMQNGRANIERRTSSGFSFHGWLVQVASEKA